MKKQNLCSTKICKPIKSHLIKSKVSLHTYPMTLLSSFMSRIICDASRRKHFFFPFALLAHLPSIKRVRNSQVFVDFCSLKVTSNAREPFKVQQQTAVKSELIINKNIFIIIMLDCFFCINCGNNICKEFALSLSLLPIRFL